MSIAASRLKNFLTNVVGALEASTPPSVEGGRDALERLRSEANEWVKLGQGIGYFEDKDASPGLTTSSAMDEFGFGRALEDAWSGVDSAQIHCLALVHFASDHGWRSATNRAQNSLRSEGASTSRDEDLAWMWSSHDGNAADPSAWRVAYSGRASRRMRDIARLRTEASTAQPDVQPQGEADSSLDALTRLTPLSAVANIEQYRAHSAGDELVSPLEGTTTAEQAEWFAGAFESLVAALRDHSPGREDEAELLMASLFAGQHVLIEYEPGTRPSDIARSLAAIISGTFSVIRSAGTQPSDVTGVTIYDQASHRFDFHKGPIFASVVMIDGLADAEKTTRHAVFEIMEEGTVVVDGNSFDIGAPFMIVATADAHGSALSLADRDAFGVRIVRGHLGRAATADLLRARANGRSEATPRITTDAVYQMQLLAQAVVVGAGQLDLILRIIEAGRDSNELTGVLGIEAVTSLVRLSQVFALASGRPQVQIDDILRSVRPALEHRVELMGDASRSGRTVEQALGAVVQTALGSDRGSTPGKSAAV